MLARYRLPVQFMNVIAFDFETFYSKKLKYSIRTLIDEKYCQYELFDPYMISVSDGANSWAGPRNAFNWDAIDGQMLVSHNRKFDNSVYDEMVVRGWAPKLNFAGWHCTANLTSYLCNRRSLAESFEYLMGKRLSKEARASAENKHWPQDFSPEEQKAMIDYARGDAFHCWQLWDKFSHLWPESERRLSNLTIDQGRRGVQINVELLDQYLCQSHEMLQKTEDLIPWIKDSVEPEWEEFVIKPTSSKCAAEQCRRTGIPCPPVKADDEEGYEAWETQHGPTNTWVYALTAWRSVNKLFQTLKVMKSRIRPDGSMPFGLKYFGAHTGRWSGDAKINFQNFRKRPVLCNEHGLMEANEKRISAAIKQLYATGVWPEWVKYAVDIRHLIIPRPGKRMILSDLSQIEPRVLAWMCGDVKLLEMIRGGMGIYEAFARVNMGWTGGKLKDEDPLKYNLTKIQVLGLGYGCGWEKFISIAAGYELDLTENDPEFIVQADAQVSGYGSTSKKIVADFREKNPKIPALWRNLDDDFRQSIGGDFSMTLPSGRRMKYEKVRGETRIVPDKDGKPKRKSIFTADVGGRRVETYGGKLTENAVQAIARDIFAHHLLLLEDAGVTNLFSSHDEAIIETDNPSITPKEVERIMSTCPEWISGLPVGAEAKEVLHYLK
jgi:hypothetical protein